MNTLKKLFLRTVLAIIFIVVAPLALIGLGIALYVGGWLMLLGGLADVINLFSTYDPVTAGDVAVALAKIIFAIPVGFFITFIIGYPFMAAFVIADKFDELINKKV